MPMSSMPMPASSSVRRPASSIAGVRMNDSRCDTYMCSWARAPAWRNTQRSVGTPSARARSTEHTSSAAPMSTSLLEFISLGYGAPIIRFAGPGVRISSAPCATGDQANGLPAATSENRAHSSDRCTWWSAIERPRRGPQGGLEHRVDLHGHAHTGGDLRRVAHVDAAAVHVVGDDALGHVRPAEVDVVAPGPCPAPPRLAADEQGEIQLAALDLAGRQRQQILRAVAAAVVEAGVRAGVADRLGDEAGRVAVAPRQQRHRPHGVRPRNPVEPGVDGRGACGVGHQIDGRAGLVEAGCVMHRLAHTDQDGQPRIDRHGRRPYRRASSPANRAGAARCRLL